MSSLRNAVKRITHKERSQPQHRSHLGQLEKHKDYTKRARDFHRKQDALRALRGRASGRNPDEFYHAMHNSRVRDGRHQRTDEARDREMADTIGPDAVKIMKNQDVAYARLIQARDAKKIERLQSSLHLLEGGDGDSSPANKKRKHTIFVDGVKEAEEFDPAEHFDTVPEFVGRAFNRPRVETLLRAAKERIGADNDDDADDSEKEEEAAKRTKPKTAKEMRRLRRLERRRMEKIAKARNSAYSELEARNKRMASMALAEAHLVTERLVSSKGRKRKVKDAEDGKPAVYKWRRRRAK